MPSHNTGTYHNHVTGEDYSGCSQRNDADIRASGETFVVVTRQRRTNASEKPQKVLKEIFQWADPKADRERGRRGVGVL